ncbi:MAG: MFS transporter [Alphaproteobacteria bacterium]|nr:MFS transporter [Alphaproteobacteria bacterium]
MPDRRHSSSIRRNLLLFKISSFFDWWPVGAVMIIYFESITQSYATASLVFSVYMLTQALSEIPVGIISDRWSRKKTMLACGVFSISFALCLVIAGSMQSTALLFAGALCWGLAEAFGTGTDEALMYETMKDLKKRGKYDVVFSGVRAWGYAGAAASTIAAVPLYYFFGLGSLAIASIVPAAAQFITYLFYTEPKSYRPSGANSLKHIIAALKNFKRDKIRALAAAQTMNYSWNETQYRINSAYYGLFMPTWAVNIVVFVYHMLTSFGFYIAIRLRRIGLLKMALASNVFKSITTAAGLVLNNSASPFVLTSAALGTGGEHSAESALLQREFSDHQRATMRSIVAIFGGVLSALAFWFFGLLADVYSVYAALVGLLVYKVIISLYYWWLMRKYR